MSEFLVKGQVASAVFSPYATAKGRKILHDGVKAYSLWIHCFSINGDKVENPEIANQPYLLIDLIVYADYVRLNDAGKIEYLHLTHPTQSNFEEDLSVDISLAPQKTIILIECSSIHARLLSGTTSPARSGKAFKFEDGRQERPADIIHRIDQSVIVDAYLPTMRCINAEPALAEIQSFKQSRRVEEKND